MVTGGQIGHRKYDCPEQRNFTASIICRVCGNAGHMARDCPDRQRGSDWRNSGPGGAGRGQRAIEGGDAVDREMEVSNPFLIFKEKKKTYTNFISSNLCKNFLVAHHLQPTVKNHEESKVDLTALTKTVETAMELIATVISAVMIVI